MEEVAVTGDDGTPEYVDYDASNDVGITVFCDNPKHARGKVAKIETFARIAAFGDSWLTRSDLPGPRSVESHRSATGEIRQNYRCKLCNLNWPTKDYQRVLDQIAVQGVSRISLYELIVIASKQQ